MNEAPRTGKRLELWMHDFGPIMGWWDSEIESYDAARERRGGTMRRGAPLKGGWRTNFDLFGDGILALGCGAEPIAFREIERPHFDDISLEDYWIEELP